MTTSPSISPPYPKIPPHQSSIILPTKQKKKEKGFMGRRKADRSLGRKAILWGEERQINFLGEKKEDNGGMIMQIIEERCHFNRLVVRSTFSFSCREGY